jgi:hypothetical protein
MDIWYEIVGKSKIYALIPRRMKSVGRIALET